MHRTKSSGRYAQTARWGRVSVLLGFALMARDLSAAGKETFTGTIIIPRGLDQIKTPLTLTVEQYTTEEEAQALRALYGKSGWDEALKALRESSKGSASLRDLTWPINWVRAFPGKDGARRILIITVRPISLPDSPEPNGRGGGAPRHEPEDTAPTANTDPVFGVIQLDLNASGRGEGSITGGAKIRITPEGNVQVETATTTPRRVVGVQAAQ